MKSPEMGVSIKYCIVLYCITLYCITRNVMKWHKTHRRRERVIQLLVRRNDTQWINFKKFILCLFSATHGKMLPRPWGKMVLMVEPRLWIQFTVQTRNEHPKQMQNAHTFLNARFFFCYSKSYLAVMFIVSRNRQTINMSTCHCEFQNEATKFKFLFTYTEWNTMKLFCHPTADTWLLFWPFRCRNCSLDGWHTKMPVNGENNYVDVASDLSANSSQ